jgi:hypothetical protein
MTLCGSSSDVLSDFFVVRDDLSVLGSIANKVVCLEPSFFSLFFVEAGSPKMNNQILQRNFKQESRNRLFLELTSASAASTLSKKLSLF